MKKILTFLSALFFSYGSFAVVGPITLGADSMCIGGSNYATDTTLGGTFTSSNPAIATIEPTGGLLIPVSPGVVTITYTVGTSYATTTFTVLAPTSISGPTGVCSGRTDTFTDATPGGVWSLYDTTIASINTVTGAVTGISDGANAVYYTDPSTGCTQTFPFWDHDTCVGEIAGLVGFPSGFMGTFKVWLITFNTTTLDLEAVDSQTFTFTDTVDWVNYIFTGEPTDSYRVKAGPDYSVSGTGYIPTYHNSSFYWHDANVINHTYANFDDNENITMVYGTVSAGPGFISGNVSMGANRATSGSGPSVGLLMIAESESGVIYQQTYTDASGNYSFSGLPVGTYTIHPEAINYVSTDYSGISLTTAIPTSTTANFIQHTLSHTITPGSTGIATLSPTASAVITYPSPTNGTLNIQWKEAASEAGVVTLTDLTGRNVYKSNLNMVSGNGSSQIDLSALTDGLYIINISSAEINYIDKIQVQH